MIQEDYKILKEMVGAKFSCILLGLLNICKETITCVGKSQNIFINTQNGLLIYVILDPITTLEFTIIIPDIVFIIKDDKMYSVVVDLSKGRFELNDFTMVDCESANGILTTTTNIKCKSEICSVGDKVFDTEDLDFVDKITLTINQETRHITTTLTINEQEIPFHVEKLDDGTVKSAILKIIENLTNPDK